MKRKWYHNTYQKTITVRCPKCGWMDEKDVKFINIEEDMMGRDVLTFECPTCKMTRKSNRHGYEKECILHKWEYKFLFILLRYRSKRWPREYKIRRCKKCGRSQYKVYLDSGILSDWFDLH